MAQPNQASNQDPLSQLDELERSAEPADRTNTRADNSQDSPKPDTTAVVTQVTKQNSTPVNADQAPQDGANPSIDGAATDPNAQTPTDASGTSDQPGESGSTDNPTDGDNNNGDDKDEGTSANNGVPPPPTSDLHGLELSINEIPNFDSFVTREELRNLIDKVIQSTEESGYKNSRELLILREYKRKYFNLMSIRSICSFLLGLNLGIELPAILKKITQGVRK